jgi:exonuclease VII large subunit
MATLLTFMEQKSSSMAQNLRRPDDIIHQAHLQLDQWNQRMTRATSVYMTHIEQRYDQLHLRLTQASVEKVLERGFCLALDPSGRPISSEQHVPEKDPFTLKFHDGTAQVSRHRVPIQPRLF